MTSLRCVFRSSMPGKENRENDAGINPFIVVMYAEYHAFCPNKTVLYSTIFNWTSSSNWLTITIISTNTTVQRSITMCQLFVVCEF